jgi:hypothetical protein
MSYQNRKMKINIKTIATSAALVTSVIVLIIPTLAAAAVPNGYFSSKQMKMGQKSGDVDVYIQSSADVAFGLILFQEDGNERGQGGFYRIEELPDGTQAWIHLYQGEGGFLRTNPDELPALKGIYTANTNDPKLRLIPAEGSALCQNEFREILVEPKSGDDEWREFPTQDLVFPRGERGSKGTLTGGKLFTGSLIFEGSSHSAGTFILGPQAPGVATIRAQVMDPQSLSGWSLSRNLLGVAASIYQSRERVKLVVIEYSNNQDRCMDPTTWLKSR